MIPSSTNVQFYPNKVICTVERDHFFHISERTMNTEITMPIRSILRRPVHHKLPNLLPLPIGWNVRCNLGKLCNCTEYVDFGKTSQLWANKCQELDFYLYGISNNLFSVIFVFLFFSSKSKRSPIIAIVDSIFGFSAIVVSIDWIFCGAIMVLLINLTVGYARKYAANPPNNQCQSEKTTIASVKWRKWRKQWFPQIEVVCTHRQWWAAQEHSIGFVAVEISSDLALYKDWNFFGDSLSVEVCISTSTRAHTESKKTIALIFVQ